MTENDAQLLAADPTWWKAPVVATLLGLPLLVWELSLYGVDSYLSGPEVMIYGGFALLAIAWTLPRRRSARMLRITAACCALGCAVLPFVFLVMMAMAMASG
ncbi:hypothetical protein ACIBU0_06595 [Streptomyces sp. NPDC049627]|uniref:hypothetical protein n=1 Tax=Streptomyces sp. NPDC049627 TaxID=3365595 RepID=UPI003793F796